MFVGLAMSGGIAQRFKFTTRLIAIKYSQTAIMC